MCFIKAPKIAAPQVAAYDNREALRTANMEARLRRRRSGAAADVLTGPGGIPTTATLGGVAA